MYLMPPAVVALTLAFTPAFAAVDAVPAAQETRALAETVVKLSDERENEAKALEALDDRLSDQIAVQLSTTDPGVIARLKQVVHDALSPVVQKAGDVMVDGYAANFSTEELGRVIAFLNSPEGQAEKVNLPLLKRELAAALSGSPKTATAGEAAAQAFAAASPEKRALVQRILTAQHFETHTRQGYAALQATLKAVASQAGLRASAGPAGSENDPRAADDYVRLVTEVEEGFYVTHYTDEQLAAAATHLESEPGQAVVTRLPTIKRAMGAVLAHGLSSAISSLPEQVCKTVVCSTDQRSRLAAFTTFMASFVASSVSDVPLLAEPSN